MRVFQLLIAMIVVVHMIGAAAVMTCTIHQPPRTATAAATAAASDAAKVTEPAFVVTPPRRKPAGPGAFVLLLVHTLLVFGSGTWLICTVLAHHQPAGPSATSPERSLTYLQERTQRAGEFVILDHATEDLQPLRPHELEAALAAAREQDPTLELREVAGRWILRRPRI